MQAQVKEEQQIKSDTKVITDGRFKESASLLNSNFVPIDFTEFLQALINICKQRRVQFYENLKRSKKNKHCLKEF